MTHTRRGDAQASALAECQAITWRRVLAQLAPIIGGRAVNVLLERALQQIEASFPWISTSAAPHPNIDALLGDLKIQLSGQSVTAATDACFALRLAFSELLERLIGNSLTERLVGSAWESSPPPSATEPEHE